MLALLKLRDKFSEYLSNFYWDIGVDLGSSRIRIYLLSRGIVIDEPLRLARRKRKRWVGLSAPKASLREPVAFGEKAAIMQDREPRQIEVVSPVSRGGIADLEAASALVSYYLKLVYEVKSRYPKILKPRVVVGVPSGVNEVQRRAVRSIFLSSGARQVFLVEQPVAVAVGVGLPVKKSSGLVIVDVGGGKTEVSVVSMGGVVAGRSIKVGGDDFDEAIINFVKMKYGVLMGKRSAEQLKMQVGDKRSSLLIRGRDLEDGLPKTIKLSEPEFLEAVGLLVEKIVKTVSGVLDETPPELMNDVLKRGIVLVGGGAKLLGLAKKIEKETKITTSLAEEPDLAEIRGCGQLLEKPELLDQIRLVSPFW